MSPKMIPLEQAPPPPWYLRIPALVAIGAARVTTRSSPKRMRSVLVALSRGARPATVAEASWARDAIVGTSMRCAGPRCLERSIATVFLCRIRGVWPEWRTGVAIHPFQAHAWVEAEGRPVGEDDREIALFTTTMRVAPGSG